MMSDVYAALLTHAKETGALASVAGRTSWDQETMMPPGAAEQRGAEMAALERVLHARRSDPRIGAWLAALPSDLDPVAAAQTREIKRSFERATKVPADLAARLAEVTSLAQGDWARARAADDMAAFSPRLAEVVRLKREEAQALAAGGDPYDALLQDYEPGASAASLSEMFEALRPRLVALREAVLGADIKYQYISGQYDTKLQLELARLIAERFGYDFHRGRLDLAVHPFSSGSGADVRITTRTDPADPFNCLYSTIHEVGHACYEQAVEDAYALTPIGRGASMGVHESQSRIYENQLARSEAFTGWLYDRMRAKFGALPVDNARDFYGLVNRVGSGFIRTEADEVHYNLHVMLRFDLERALIAGDLAVTDLEDAWNTRFSKDFGEDVPKASLGCLQDVHWSVGLFGYFPTYTLGNLYAGCLYKALRADVETLDADLADGDPGQATAWLRARLQRHGTLRDPAATIAHATGAAPSAEPLLSYLEAKFGDLYGL